MSQDESHGTIRAAMVGAGVRPEILYAFDKTGRVVTDENAALLTVEDLAEWQAAIDEYRRAHP